MIERLSLDTTRMNDDDDAPPVIEVISYLVPHEEESMAMEDAEQMMTEMRAALDMVCYVIELNPW